MLATMICGLKNMLRKLTEFQAATHGCWSSQKIMLSATVICLKTSSVGAGGSGTVPEAVVAVPVTWKVPPSAGSTSCSTVTRMLAAGSTGSENVTFIV